MKKSLMLISFAFIFLLSVSVVSAGFFDWITGDALTKTTSENPPLSLKEGKTAELSPTLDVQVVKIDAETGIVEATVTNTETGGIENIQLQEGKIATLNDGTKISAGGLTDGGLFTKPKAEINVLSSSDLSGIAEGGELFSGEFGETGFGGGNICETLFEEEALLYLGQETLLNEHFVNLDEEGVLTIDGTYSTPLTDGGNYIVPIPNPNCYWETSFKDGELYMRTVCFLPEEGVLEEPLV